MREDGQRICSVLGKTPGSQRILLWDDFEGLLKWKVYGVRYRPRISKSQTRVFDGNYALKLTCPNTIPNGAKEGIAYRDFHVAPDGVVKLELVYSSDPGASGWALGFYFNKWIDGIKHRAGLQRSPYSGTWRYLNEDNDWIQISGSAVPFAWGAWHRVSFTVDLASGEYIEFESDAMRMGLLGLKFRKVSAAFQAVTQGVMLSAWVNGGGVSHCYDNILVRAV